MTQYSIQNTGFCVVCGKEFVGDVATLKEWLEASRAVVEVCLFCSDSNSCMLHQCMDLQVEARVKELLNI